MDRRLTIAIPIWNKLEITRQCIDSLISKADYPHKVLIIDNGSAEETAKILKDYCDRSPHFSLKRFDENVGYLAAANHALSTFDTPYLCLLNNDTVLTATWMSECVSILESRPDIGIVSPTTNEISDRYKKIFVSGKIRENKGKFIETTNGLGSCFFVKRQVVDAIGLFDTAFSPGYFEEIDYSLRARDAGYSSVMALGAYITHLSGTSFNELGSGRAALWHRNREIFESRWGRSERILVFLKEKYDAVFLLKLRKYLLARCRRRAIVEIYSKNPCDWIEGTHLNIRKKSVPLYNGFILALLLAAKKKSYDLVITDSTPSPLNPAKVKSVTDLKALLSANLGDGAI